MKLLRLISFLLVPILSLGCKTNTPQPAAAPMAAPQTGMQVFTDQAAGISFTYPAGWKSATPEETKFTFTSGDTKTAPIKMTLDVPKFSNPFNIFPMDTIRSRYADDAKKKMPDAKVANLPDPAVPDAKQRRVKLTGTVDGKPSVNEAVILVHNNKIYILSIDAGADAYPQAVKALDGAVASLKW